MAFLIQCPFPGRFPVENSVLIGAVAFRGGQEDSLLGESADWPPWSPSSKQDEPFDS